MDLAAPSAPVSSEGVAEGSLVGVAVGRGLVLGPVMLLLLLLDWVDLKIDRHVSSSCECGIQTVRKRTIGRQ